MTDFKTSDRDVNRAIRSWLHEDRHEDVSRVAGAVLDQVDTIPQRRATWWPARRTPTMNKFLTIGLGAAAVVVAVLVGVSGLRFADNGGVGAGPTASAPSRPPAPNHPRRRPHAPGADPELHLDAARDSVSYPEGCDQLRRQPALVTMARPLDCFE